MCALATAEMTAGAARRGFFFAGARTRDLSAMGKERRQFVFRYRLIAQSEFDRNIVEPAWSEAAVEMPQSRDDHSNDGDFDVRPGLVENQEIEPRTPGDVDAGQHLIAGVVEPAEIEARGKRRVLDGRQERIAFPVQRRDAVEAWLLAGAAIHEADREELVQFRQGAQQR